MAYIGTFLSYLNRTVRFVKQIVRFGLAFIIFASLAACADGSKDLASTLGLKSDAGLTTGSIKKPMKSVAFAPLVGVPANVSQNLLTAVKAAARANNLPVKDDVASASYLIRGYLVATPEKTGAKLSYIWDINDNRGVRIHRVLGNELIKGKKPTNGWSLVNQQVIAKVANASAFKLNGWFTNAANSRSRGTVPKTNEAGPKRISPIARRENNGLADPVITGAVGRRKLSFLTFVKPVQGAPGDGRISLTNALRRELQKNGIALTKNKVSGGYTVQGSVKLTSAKVQGRQNVHIVWNVYDEKAHRVGTVSQKNEIPIGSLNGSWGPTAEAAASAAAKGIVKLLPSKH